MWFYFTRRGIKRQIISNHIINSAEFDMQDLCLDGSPTFMSVYSNMRNEICFYFICTNLVEQHSADILPIAVLQTRPAELTFGPHTEPTATDRLSVQSLLPALVTRAALQRQMHTDCDKPWEAEESPWRSPQEPVDLHLLLVPDLVFAAVRYVVQVFFCDLIDWPHVKLALSHTVTPPLLLQRFVHLSSHNTDNKLSRELSIYVKL